MNELSKDELIKLYETLPEDTLIKLGVHDNAKQAYEEKQRVGRLKKERIEKAITLVKEAQELLNIYGLELKVTGRGIRIVDKDGRAIHNNIQKQISSAKQGVKTHQSQYGVPMLQSLTDLGGRGRVTEVLERVYERMKDVLVPFDLEKVSTGVPRWYNTAQWERNKMVNEGLLRNDSPRGIWEISEKGSKYLKEHINE